MICDWGLYRSSVDLSPDEAHFDFIYPLPLSEQLGSGYGIIFFSNNQFQVKMSSKTHGKTATISERQMHYLNWTEI
jgi:hypothetical protein